MSDSRASSEISARFPGIEKPGMLILLMLASNMACVGAMAQTAPAASEAPQLAQAAPQTAGSTTANPAVAPSNAAPDSQELDQITVTATRRRENLNSGY